MEKTNHDPSVEVITSDIQPIETPDQKKELILAKYKKPLVLLGFAFLIVLPLLMYTVLQEIRLNSRASMRRVTVTPVTPPTPTDATATPTPTTTPSISPSSDCITRPKCLDARPACKLPERDYCPPPTPKVKKVIKPGI